MGGPSSLEWLLDPITLGDFYEQYYEASPLLVSRADPEHFASLPDLDSIDQLLGATVSNRLQPAYGERIVRSEVDGTLSERTVRVAEYATVDLPAIYRSYHDGFTIAINQMHRRCAPVGRLCRGLQAELHHPVGANLYLTPPQAQGFLPHVDTHDVFILQLRGIKEWHVSSPSVELPLAHMPHGKQALPDPRTFKLAQGHTLYLPRGSRHEAIAGDSSSLHLTVGVHAFRWHDLLKNALELVANADVAFRRALPRQYLNEPLEPEDVAELASRFKAALTDGDVIDKARQQIASKFIAADTNIGLSRFRSLDLLRSLTPDTIVARPPDVVCLVQVTAEHATIKFPGNFVSGPRILESAFRFVAQRDRFAVSELPGSISTEDRLDLVKRLVSEGLLEVCEYE